MGMVTTMSYMANDTKEGFLLSFSIWVIAGLGTKEGPVQKLRLYLKDLTES